MSEHETVTMYRCRTCGEPQTKEQIVGHELDCRSQADTSAKLAEMRQRQADRLRQKAIGWARTNQPLLLLVAHGWDEAAEDLCRYRWSESLVDVSTGETNGIYTDMLEAARAANGEDTQ